MLCYFFTLIRNLNNTPFQNSDFLNYLGEDVDVRDLQVDHNAEGGHGARDELAAVNHEVGVDEKYTAYSDNCIRIIFNQNAFTPYLHLN